MSSQKALDFMVRHGMSAAIDPAEYAELMRQDMERGLKGREKLHADDTNLHKK